MTEIYNLLRIFSDIISSMSSDSSDTSVNTGYSDSSDCDSQDTVDELSQPQVDSQTCDPYRSDKVGRGLLLIYHGGILKTIFYIASICSFVLLNIA